MEILREYGVAATILFPLIERGSQDFRDTGIAFAAIDTQISKDEGAFANTGSVPLHEGKGIYSLALTATEMQAARIAITCIDNTSVKLWEDQAILIQTFGDAASGLLSILPTAIVPYAAVEDTGFTPTTTQFETDDITEATADHFKDRVVIFRGGVLDGQAKDITAYSLVGGRGRFTVSTLTDAPVDGQLFIIV